MKTTIALFSILLLFLIAQSCKRETQCGDLSDVVTTYNIADSNKAKIPYTGKDTLVFISDEGNTTTLIGQGKKDTYETISKIISGGDCPRSQVDRYQNIDINYLGSNNDFFQLYYRVAKVAFDHDLTGIEIICNTNYRVGGILEYFFYNLPVDDSINISNVYITGGYLDEKKTILYNSKFGLLKIKLPNKIWTKMK